MKKTFKTIINFIMSNLKRFNQMIVHPNTDAYLTSVLAERKGEFINNLTAVVTNDAKLQACEPVTLVAQAAMAEDVESEDLTDTESNEPEPATEQTLFDNE